MDKKIGRKANINIKIDYLSKEKLINIAKEKRVNLEDLLINIIDNYLQEENSNQEVINNQESEEIKQNYQQLNQRLMVLEAKNLEADKIDNRISLLEKLVENLQYQISPRHINKTANYDFDDDIDDEPDEILTDFLA